MLNPKEDLTQQKCGTSEEISWTEKKSTEEVMKMARYEKFLLKTTRKRQLQFLGHIYRERADKLDLSKYSVEKFVVPKADEDNAKNTQTI